MTGVITVDFDRHYDLTTFPDYSNLFGDSNPPLSRVLRPAHSYYSPFTRPYRGPQVITTKDKPGREIATRDNLAVPVPAMFRPARVPCKKKK